MSQTFTLRRLMMGVTLLCVLLALGVNFPVVSLVVALVIGHFIPTIVVCAVLPWFSSRRVLTLNVALVGAIVGFLVAPAMHVHSAGLPDVWDMVSLMLASKALPAAAGAIIAGFACVGFFPRRIKARQEIDRA